jgi:type IV pilus assembly protein PilN
MIRINLLPVREARRKAGLRQQGVMLAGALGIGCAIALILHISVESRLSSTRHRITSTEKELRKLEATLGDVEKFRQQKQEIERKLSVITQLEASRTGPVRVMDEMASHIPERMWLTNLSLNDGAVELSGYGLDNETIADFMTKLENSPHMGRVELLESKLENEQGLKVNKFKIKAHELSSMRLANAQKAKANEKTSEKGKKGRRRRRR